MWNCKVLVVVVCLVGASLASTAVLPPTTELNGRIVGGREVTITKHPHQVSLRYKQCKLCTYSHTCGGSLYAPNIVISAAHCVQYRVPLNFLIVAGTDIRNGADGHVSRVSRIVRHQNYNFITTENDVSLLFLTTPLPLDGVHVATIPLANVLPQHGEKAVTSGWGTTTEGGYASVKLLEVTLPIVSNDLCNKYYGAGQITDSMLCAGVAGKDACQGDSGGPLLVNGTLTGIVSWGRGCARPGFPGVYASVPYLKQWILDTIAEENSM